MKNALQVQKKIFAENMQSYDLSNEQNIQMYFEAFLKPQSLYADFKESAYQIEKKYEIDNQTYIYMLQQFMKSQQLFRLKKSELLQAWIIYRISDTFKFNLHPLQIHQITMNIFNDKKIPFERFVHQIGKKNFGTMKSFLDWKKQKALQIEKFVKGITSNDFFVKYSDLFEKKQQIEKQLAQKVDLFLMQLQRDGQLIRDQYNQLRLYPNLVELQIHKHILHNFYKLYQMTYNHNKTYQQLFTKLLPLDLKTVDQIRQQLYAQNRQLPQSDLQAIKKLEKQLNNLDQRQGTQNMSRVRSIYQQIVNTWKAVKQDVIIFNTFLLERLIKNTEESTKNIKDKNILMLIGPSGAGKTTIILRLLNYQMQETTINQLPTLAPKQKLRPDHSELITSPQAKSTTKYIFSAKIDHQLIDNSQEDLYLCDTPGFFDTSGVVVDIANGIGMINAVKFAKSVKPIIVISAPMVGEKFDGIKQIGKIVSNLFEQYKKKQQGLSTEFIFNKFSNKQQFSRLEPGLLSILNNLSPNEKSDRKFVTFLQILYERLKKNSQIIKFDPFNINIKDTINKLSQNPIQNPQDVFKYSFSTTSLLALKNFVQQKLNIIINLVKDNIEHACFHIKQMKTLLSLYSNDDFKEEYQNVIDKIHQENQLTFSRFNHILKQLVIKYQANAHEISEAKDICEKIKAYNAFRNFSEIDVYIQADLEDQIRQVSQVLFRNFIQFKFSNNKQALEKKKIKITKLFSESFNHQLLVRLKDHIKNHYQQEKSILQGLCLSSDSIKFKQSYEIYSNIVTYYEFVQQQSKPIKPQTILSQKYEQTKNSIEVLLEDISKIYLEINKDNRYKLRQDIQKLSQLYVTLQFILSLNVDPNIKEQNLKHTIIQSVKEAIEIGQSKCQEVINSKECSQQLIVLLRRNLKYLEEIAKFVKVKDECKLVITNIHHSIKKTFQQQNYNLQCITQSISKNREIHPKIVGLDVTLFKIKNYCQFATIFSDEKVKQNEQNFFEEFRQFIDYIKTMIQCSNFSIKKNLKFDEITNLMKRIKQLRYLKNIKKNFMQDELDYFQNNPQKQCVNKLLEPYKEIKQSFQFQKGKIKITKKILNQISAFVQYDAHLKAINARDYEQLFLPAKQQLYQTIFNQFSQQFNKDINECLNCIKTKNGLIYKCEKQFKERFKKIMNMFSYALKNDNIRKQLKRLKHLSNFESNHQKIIALIQQNQQELQKQFKKWKNIKSSEGQLQKIRTYCYEMKDFDVYLSQLNNFSEIAQIIDKQLSNRQLAVAHKLIYIFTQSSVRYQQLKEFVSGYKQNYQIMQELMKKIKSHDKKLREEINSMDKYSQDRLFQDDNLRYIRSVNNAFIFYQQINEIVGNQLKIQDLSLSIKYFQSCLNPFIEHYQHYYEKIMDQIYNFKHNSIPKNVQVFMEELQALISKISPKDYQMIKRKISQIEFNTDFSITLPKIQDKITNNIIETNQVLRQAFEKDFTQVINILGQSGTKYYKHLSEKQKKIYSLQIRKQFDNRIKQYKAESQNGEGNSLTNFFKIVPQQIRNQLQQQFQAIKHQIQIRKEEQQFKFINEANLEMILNRFKKCNEKDKNKYKDKLISLVQYQFQTLNLLQRKEQRISKYRLLQGQCKEILQYQWFSVAFKEKEKQFKQNIFDQTLQKMTQNKDAFSMNTYQKSKIVENNQQITKLYRSIIKENIIIFQDLLLQIQDYFESIINFYHTEVKTNSMSIFHCDLQELQAQIIRKQHLQMIVPTIINSLTQDKVEMWKLAQSRQKLKNVLQLIVNNQKNNYSLQAIASQILSLHLQISNSPFSKVLSSSNIHNEQIQKAFSYQLKQKISFLVKVNKIYMKYQLNKLNIKGNTSRIGDMQLYKQRFLYETKQGLKEIQKLKQDPFKRQLSIRLNLIYELCQALKIMIKEGKDYQRITMSINLELQSKLKDTVNGFHKQIQQFSVYKKKTQGIRLQSIKMTDSEVRLFQDQKNIQKAKSIIMNLIVMEKICKRINYRQQKNKHEMLKMIGQINQINLLYNLIVQQMRKRLQYPEIKQFINKYPCFKENKLLQHSPKSYKYIKVFIEEFFNKNKDFTRRNKQQLIQLHQQFQNILHNTLNKYINSNEKQQTIKQISKDIKQNISIQAKQIMIGKIFGLLNILSIRTNKQMLKPHAAQFIAIMLLLQNAQEKIPKNSLLQMLPGEGKSAVLAGVACYLALKGKHVYQMFYSSYLAHRDYETFKQLYKQLNVNNFIHCHSFTSFIKNITKDLILKQSLINEIKKTIVDKAYSQSDWGYVFNKLMLSSLKNLDDLKEMVVLIDEIDMVFNQSFQGKTFSYSLELADEDKCDIVFNVFQYIFKKFETQIITLQDLKKTEQYKLLADKYQKILQIVQNQLVKMLQDVLDQESIDQYCKQIQASRYKQQINQAFNGYQQCFAYLKLKSKGLVSESNCRKHLKINIKLSYFSYCEILKSFEKIIGVSGSLDFLSKTQTKTLSNDYKIQFFCYLPSIYRGGKAQIKPNVIVESKEELFSKIVSEINKAFEKNIADKKALLVFLKDQQILNQFFLFFNQSNKPKIDNFKLIILAGIQPFSILCQKINNVGLNNTLTLSIKNFVQGIDYKDYDLTEGLYVIQAYLPQNIEEYNHAKGRTARGGKSGIYKLIAQSQEVLDIKKGQELFKSNILQLLKFKKKQEKKERKIKVQESKVKHEKAKKSCQKGEIVKYLIQINKNQTKRSAVDVLLTFGFPSNQSRLDKLKKWLISTLQRYENLIKQHCLAINLKCQIYLYGSYANFNSVQQIIKKSSICKSSEVQDELKNMRKGQRAKQGNSIELLFKSIAQFSGQQNQYCFIWSNSKNYNWKSFQNTNLYKLKQQQIKKSLKIKENIKQWSEYLAEIKSKNIKMYFLGTDIEVGFKRQIEQYVLSFEGKEKPYFNCSQFSFQQKLNNFFFQKMKKIIHLIYKNEAQKLFVK